MLTPVTITGTFTRADNTPASGRVIASLTAPVVNGTVTLDTAPLVCPVVNGQILSPTLGPLVLFANDDPGSTPSGSQYVFTVLLDDVPVREFQAALAHTVVSVDLSTLDPGAT